jgi:putative endonuclease
MFYTYLLQSEKDGNLYIGSTTDLKRRFKEHNSGDVLSTKSRRPLILLYYEAYSAEEHARKREHQLKLRGRALAQLRRRLHIGLQKTID